MRQLSSHLGIKFQLRVINITFNYLQLFISMETVLVLLDANSNLTVQLCVFFATTTLHKLKKILD